MKADSWEFILFGETRALNLGNWHEVELMLVRKQERRRLFMEEGAARMKEKTELEEKR